MSSKHAEPTDNISQIPPLNTQADNRAPKNETVAELQQQIKALEAQLHSQAYREQIILSSNKILQALSKRNNIEDILQLQCEQAELLHPDMHSSVLRLDKQTNQLFHVASVSLPQAYIDAINGVEIGDGVGSCGSAAFNNTQVIVEDIATHANWQPFKQYALDANLRACWSQPIHNAEGKVFGTFAMYYEERKTPSKRDLEYIEVQAHIAAIVFEHKETELLLAEHQERLSELVAEKTAKLEISLAELKDTQRQLIEAEKLAALNELVAGVAHEINTPLGIAITSISTCEDSLKQTLEAFEHSSLKRSDLQRYFTTTKDLQSISMTALTRASEIVRDFKSVAVDLGSNENRQINLQQYIKEIMHTISPNYKRSPIEISYQVEQNGEFVTHPGSIFQIISNLIQNSIIHGFEGREQGHVKLHANVLYAQKCVRISVADDGIGMSEPILEKIFTPFFTTKRGQGGSGLGLSIVHNLVVKKLQGDIQVKSTLGKGSEFIITLPLDLPARSN